MNKLLVSFFSIILLFHNVSAQSIKILHNNYKTSLRGLSVVNDNLIWVSGSNGKVGKSKDGGNTWHFNTVYGFEKTDFRDIEAFDSNTALIMGIDCPAVILKTIDGGNNWFKVFEDTTKGMFLDAMYFKNNNEGKVIGDPINGKIFMASTNNAGNLWQVNDGIKIDTGEACFASSGSNIFLTNNNKKHKEFIITGGLYSNLYIDRIKNEIPLLQGKESTGANSIGYNNKNTLIIVGGDFNKKDSILGNIAITKNNGKSWLLSKRAPFGYRSCISFINKRNWVTCGLNGVDYTKDNGKHFFKISDIGFHVCQKSKKGNAVFFAGSNGKIGKLVF